MTDFDGTHSITVDGIDYSVEVSHGNGVIRVYDIAGQLVADAEHDEMDEALHASFFDVDGRLEEFDARQPDLYEKPWREVAEWLVSVHPNN